MRENCENCAIIARDALEELVPVERRRVGVVGGNAGADLVDRLRVEEGELRLRQRERALVEDAVALVADDVGLLVNL